MSGIDLSKIPQSYTFTLEGGSSYQPIDIHLDDINLGLTGDPNRPISADLILDLKGDPANPITVDLGLDDVKVAMSLSGRSDEPITLDLGLDNINVCLSLAITQLPRARIHVPTKYQFGFCLFGSRIFDFNIAGETMLIIEANPPGLFHHASSHAPDSSWQEANNSAFHVTLDEASEDIAESDELRG